MGGRLRTTGRSRLCSVMAPRRACIRRERVGLVTLGEGRPCRRAAGGRIVLYGVQAEALRCKRRPERDSGRRRRGISGFRAGRVIGPAHQLSRVVSVKGWWSTLPGKGTGAKPHHVLVLLVLLVVLVVLVLDGGAALAAAVDISYPTRDAVHGLAGPPAYSLSHLASVARAVLLWLAKPHHRDFGPIFASGGNDR